MSAARKVNRQYMEYQADRIEMVLASHHIPARVEGGTVLPRWLRFNLTPAANAKVSKVRNLSEELALALGADDVRVDRSGHSLTIEVPRQDAEAVYLLPMLGTMTRTLPHTAVLGISDAGQPLLIRLNSPDVAHIMVCGSTGSGKTELMRTMLASLALGNPQRHLQMILIDPKRRGLEPLAHLPHLAAPLISDAKYAQQILDWLVNEMLRRDHYNVSQPNIVIAIDEVAELLIQGGQPMLDALVRLAQRGREAGLHLVVGTQKPSSQVFGSLLRANFPVRLVGRLPSATDALAAAGIGGSGAERLMGSGDFLVVNGGQTTRFQAALIPTPDWPYLNQCLQLGLGWQGAA